MAGEPDTRADSSPEAAELPRADTVGDLLDAVEARLMRGALDEALALLQRAWSQAPVAAPIQGRIAESLAACGQSVRALLQLQRACRTPGATASLWRQLGHALLRLDRLEAAREAFVQALERAPADLLALEALAATEQALGYSARADQLWHLMLHHNPEDPVALCNLWWQAQTGLDWSQAEALEPRLLAALQTQPQRTGRVPRYCLLGAPESWPLRVFRTLPTHPVSGPVLRLPRRARRRPGRLRVGYQSAHFREHATAMLAIGLFEAHDRDRVETFAFNLGAPSDDDYRSRCRAAFDHWFDLFGESDAAIAARMRAAGIDVLIDLDADNIGGRAGIAARRPAALQLHFLGHPGSTSVQGLDFFIGDAHTLPTGGEREFRERLIRLPRCYQPNDPGRDRPPPLARADVGLPPQGLALCNFNQPWKWRREVFDRWLSALRHSEDSTLTLLDPGAAARERLLAHAQAAGLPAPAQRLRFAPALPPRAHLARLGAFDLAVDQWPCGGHTTTADALWMGLPTLTCAGPRFSARVAASLMQAAQAPQWVMPDARAYHARLTELVADRGAVDAFKARWAAQRGRSPLYDMRAFARDFEDALFAHLPR